MKIIDLFCGCGGLSLGFIESGFEIISAYDNWDEAINVYQKNFDHPIYKQDLTDVDQTSTILSEQHPDMIVGGPPCQDFSSAGKRDEDNGRGELTLCFACIVSNVRPEWFVMENVSQIQGTKKLERAREIFENAGYGLTQIILDASLCGVPQKRKRFFLIGKLGEKNDFLKEYIISKMSQKPMTIRDYAGNTFGLEYYYRHPRSYARRGIFSIDEPSPTIRGVNRPIPKGYQLHPNDPVSSLDGIRCLTTKERFIIQTFPDTFVYDGSKTNLEQMVGNAVPVKLAKFVADSIMDYHISPQKSKENQLSLF